MRSMLQKTKRRKLSASHFSELLLGMSNLPSSALKILCTMAQSVNLLGITQIAFFYRT